jgi:hypothetical protein
MNFHKSNLIKSNYFLIVFYVKIYFFESSKSYWKHVDPHSPQHIMSWFIYVCLTKADVETLTDALGS